MTITDKKYPELNNTLGQVETMDNGRVIIGGNKVGQVDVRRGKYLVLNAAGKATIAGRFDNQDAAVRNFVCFAMNHSGGVFKNA